MKTRRREDESKTITDHTSWEMGKIRLLSREMGKEQRGVSLDGKMIALVWHKLAREMGFSKGISGT